MSVEDDDKAAHAVQKTFQRIPLDYINEQIDNEYWPPMPEPIGHMSVVVLVLKNGFMVIGNSAPADPENYDPELGRKFAREDAIRQLWPLFAFALRCNIAGQDVLKDLTGRVD